MKTIKHPMWWLGSWGAATFAVGATLAIWDTISFWIVVPALAWWEVSMIGFCARWWNLERACRTPPTIWPRPWRKNKRE